MKKSDLLLTGLIFLGLIGGVIVGQFFLFDRSATPEMVASVIGPWEQAGRLLFIRPLQLMTLPIVFIAVVAGVASIGNPQKLGVLGVSTLGYYLLTMMAAISLGLILVTTIAPGGDVTEESRQALIAESGPIAEGTQQRMEAGASTGLGEIILNLGERLIATNPVEAAAEGNTLGIVFFAILLGLAIVSVGKSAEPVKAVFDGLFEALLKLVTWIIWLAPVGVFLLVSARIGETGLANIAGPVGTYALVVVAGLLIHALVTLPVFLVLLVRVNPFVFLWQLRKPVLLAFSTASSAATMPVTIEEAQRSGKCSERATNFVVPLGATVNMDGTALYQAVAVVFLFQLYGIDLDLGTQLIILLTATFAAVGTAAVPSAGLITMAIVITAVNNSLTSMGREQDVLPLAAIAIILGIDRILDMCRTAVNVWGDAVGARIMTRLAPDDPEESPAA